MGLRSLTLWEEWCTLLFLKSFIEALDLERVKIGYYGTVLLLAAPYIGDTLPLFWGVGIPDEDFFIILAEPRDDEALWCVGFYCSAKLR